MVVGGGGDILVAAFLTRNLTQVTVHLVLHEPFCFQDFMIYILKSCTTISNPDLVIEILLLKPVFLTKHQLLMQLLWEHIF